MRIVTALSLFVVLSAAASAAPPPPRATAQDPARKTLVAVFAHPDDEIHIGPLLAAYARRGARVHLVIVTDGEKGVSPHAKVPAGPELAKVRAGEAACSCRELGIESPTLLGFKDGELGQIGLPAGDKTRRALPPGGHLAAVRNRISKTLEQLRPDAIVTFGPEGYYGHADHRLVGALVTELVQAGTPGLPTVLLYPAFPTDRLARMPSMGIEWAGTDSRFLTVRVPFEAADLKATQAALACHKSQFPAAQVEPLVGFLGKLLDGRVYLRPWFGSAATDDIFQVAVR